MNAPERITLYRRIMSDKWHLAEAGETMSHGNADYAEYTLAPTLAEALAVVKAWAMEHFVSDGCKPIGDRAPGCLSCDTLHFIEAMEEEPEDASTAIGEAAQ